jgi:hypothetical protein
VLSSRHYFYEQKMKGFSLVSVLVALSILSLVALAMTKTQVLTQAQLVFVKKKSDALSSLQWLKLAIQANKPAFHDIVSRWQTKNKVDFSNGISHVRRFNHEYKAVIRWPAILGQGDCPQKKWGHFHCATLVFADEQ